MVFYLLVSRRIRRFERSRLPSQGESREQFEHENSTDDVPRNRRGTFTRRWPGTAGTSRIEYDVGE